VIRCQTKGACQQSGAPPDPGGVINTALIIAKQASTRAINCAKAIFKGQICLKPRIKDKLREIFDAFYPITLMTYTVCAKHMTHSQAPIGVGAVAAFDSRVLPCRPAPRK